MLLGLLLWPGGASAGTVWNLGADWSTTTNPNGPWSYNQGATPLSISDFNAAWDTPDFTGGVHAWTTAGSIPVWFRYAGEHYNGSFDALAGDVITHTQGNPLSNVTWTSPIDGGIDITGGLWMPRQTVDDRDSQWALYLNSTVLASGDISAHLAGRATRAAPSSFDSGWVAVHPGDVVKLVFTPYIGVNGDFVAMNLNIAEEVPESATAWLLAGSVLLLAAKFRLSNRA